MTDVCHVNAWKAQKLKIRVHTAQVPAWRKTGYRTILWEAHPASQKTQQQGSIPKFFPWGLILTLVSPELRFTPSNGFVKRGTAQQTGELR